MSSEKQSVIIASCLLPGLVFGIGPNIFIDTNRVFQHLGIVEAFIPAFLKIHLESMSGNKSLSFVGGLQYTARRNDV